MPDTEPMLQETPDLWADIREQTADFQAGVQEIFHELDAMRQSLEAKEEALGFQAELVAEQLGRFTESADHFELLRAEFAELVSAGVAAGNASANNNDHPLFDSLETQLAKFDSQFTTAIGSLELIPVLCNREETLENEISRLREEMAQTAVLVETSKAEQRELTEDLAAERERSARLEATLAATERDLNQQRELITEELASIRTELQSATTSQPTPDQAIPSDEPAKIEAVKQASKTEADESGKSATPKRSRRRRKSR